MNIVKTGFLAAVAGSLLLGATGLAGGSNAFAAAGTGVPDAGTSAIGSVACAPASGNWTDCTISLNQNIGMGGEVAASVPSESGTLAFCDNRFPLGTLCGVSGNTAIFTCVVGCTAGTQFVESVLNAASTPSVGSLAQQISLTVGGSPAQSASSATPGS